MKRVRHILMLLLMCMALTGGAFAANVPESFVCENLNGQQRIVKTYLLPATGDPDALREEPFDYEGYHYAWAYTTKTEHPFNMSKTATETVTVETAKNDLTQILDQLAPTIAYDDGEYSGELALDHTTLHTEAAGYETRRSTITETKTIGQLSSNDMSYIPATAVKNGKTLSLASVEWQVSGTALVGEELVPSEFQAIATYTGSSSYQAATGYVTTAEYKGEVTAEGIESITYTVVFTGEKIEPLDLEAAPARMFQDNGMMMWLLLGITAALLIGSSAFLVLKRKNVYVYVPGSKPRDYKLVAKFRLKKEDEPIIDLSGVDIDPEGNVAIEIKRSLAKRLKGRAFSVECVGGLYQYTVQNDKPGDWHEFNQKTMKEVTS